MKALLHVFPDVPFDESKFAYARRMLNYYLYDKNGANRLICKYQIIIGQYGKIGENSLKNLQHQKVSIR